MINIATRLRQWDSWLLLKAIVSCWLLWCLAPALLPDEAQYWVWSQNLDVGYYSKPPGIAWVIAISTSIFGSSAWSVRLPSVLLSWLGAYYMARGLRAMGFSESYFRSVARLFAFCPLILYGSFAATTDVGLLTAWSALLCFLVEQGRFRYLKLMLASFLGSLFKPTILLMAPAQLLRPSKAEEPGCSRMGDGLSIAAGCLLALLFPLLWNMKHDWATVRHMIGQLVGNSVGSSPSWSWIRPVEWSLTQIFLLSPWIAWQTMKSATSLFKKSHKTELTWNLSWLIFFARFSLLALAWVFLASLKVKYQANWAAFVYPQLFYLLAWGLAYNWRGKLQQVVRWHAVVHSTLFLIILYACVAQEHGSWPLSNMPWKWNVFRSAMGCDKLEPELKKIGFDPSSQFIFSDKYQTVSQLSFYVPKAQVYWFNLHQARRNQFSFWPVPASWIGKSAIFVAVESESLEAMQQMAGLYMERILPYFEGIEDWGVIPLMETKNVRSMMWIRVQGYRGTRPPDPERY